VAEDGRNYPWIKLWTRGWLTGTIRGNMTPAERSVWADLLAMANESRVRGTICRAKGVPYERSYLANYLDVPIELLNSTIEKCLGDKNAQDDLHRIEVSADGCIVISNWQKYQAKPEGKGKRFESARERELRERRDLHIKAGRYPDETAKVVKDFQHREEARKRQKDVQGSGKLLQQQGGEQ
jgi:hypothetical protein